MMPLLRRSHWVRSLSAGPPRCLRDIPRHSATFRGIPRHLLNFKKIALFGHLPFAIAILGRRDSLFSISGFQLFSISDPRLSTPKTNFKKVHDSRTQAPPVSALQYFSFSHLPSKTQ